MWENKDELLDLKALLIFYLPVLISVLPQEKTQVDGILAYTAHFFLWS